MGSNVVAAHWSHTRSCATLRARHLDREASWVLELSGEADIATLPLLRFELAQLLAANREDSVVDLTRLAFCDVASAQLILRAQQKVPVKVSGATGTVKRVLDLLDAWMCPGNSLARTYRAMPARAFAIHISPTPGSVVQQAGRERGDVDRSKDDAEGLSTREPRTATRFG